jgi:thymidine kinase
MKHNTLEIVMGPMFSGKSTELLRRIRLAKTIQKRVLVVKPRLDTRYQENRLVTHSLESEDCETVETLNELDERIDKYDYIVIDEGQFFPDLLDTVIRWVDKYKKTVLVGGLDGDFRRQSMGQLLQLIPFADSCVKLSSLCVECNDGNPACFTHRTSGGKTQIQIGGSESYIPLCRFHYLMNL